MASDTTGAELELWERVAWTEWGLTALKMAHCSQWLSLGHCPCLSFHVLLEVFFLSASSSTPKASGSSETLLRMYQTKRYHIFVFTVVRITSHVFLYYLLLSKHNVYSFRIQIVTNNETVIMATLRSMSRSVVDGRYCHL
jgi:hypothetical protein